LHEDILSQENGMTMDSQPVVCQIFQVEREDFDIRHSAHFCIDICFVVSALSNQNDHPLRFKATPQPLKNHIEITRHARAIDLGYHLGR
jgi:hypothetical protein